MQVTHLELLLLGLIYFQCLGLQYSGNQRLLFSDPGSTQKLIFISVHILLSGHKTQFLDSPRVDKHVRSSIKIWLFVRHAYLYHRYAIPGLACSKVPFFDLLSNFFTRASQSWTKRLVKRLWTKQLQARSDDNDFFGVFCVS